MNDIMSNQIPGCTVFIADTRKDSAKTTDPTVLPSCSRLGTSKIERLACSVKELVSIKPIT